MIKLVPVSTIEVNLGINEGGSMQAFFTDECANRMDKYIPKRTGNLRRNIQKTKDTITYQSSYAERQYSKEYKNYTTPGTGPHWDKKMLSAEKDKLMDDLKKYARRRGIR